MEEMQGLFTRLLVKSAGSLFHLGWDWLMGFLGWPGLVALACGCLLLLSLSARAVKFINSPRGVATSGAVMLAALLAMWWLWPNRAAASPVERASYEPSPLRGDGPRRKSTLAAKAVAAKPASGQVVKRAANGPYLAMSTPIVPVVPPPPLVVAVPNPRPPVIVQPKHESGPHATAKPTPHVAAARPVEPQSRPAMPQANPALLEAQRLAAQRQDALRKASEFQMQGLRRVQMQNAREMAAFNQQYNAMMGGMTRGYYGGVHPGVIHHGGTSHPASGAHHAGHR